MTLMTMLTLGAFSQSHAEPADSVAAIVDDKVISSLDLEDRMALVLGTTGLADTPENRARILPQVIRQLIDEELQMQEAQRLGITVGEEQLQGGINRIEKQNNRVPGSLEQYLEAKKIPKTSFYHQVKAQIAWSEIIQRAVRSRVHISDQEVARESARRTGKGQTSEAPAGASQEVRLATILLPVDAPNAEAGVRKLADHLSEEIRQGLSFEAVAGQFSSSTGSTRFIDPFWIGASQLDPMIAQALSNAAKGTVTAPIRTPGGFQIIKLLDRRTAQAAQGEEKDTGEHNVEIAFKQILMRLKPDAKTKEAELLLKLAGQVRQSPGKCTDASVAGARDMEDLDFRVKLLRAPAARMPKKLRDILLDLQPGGVSQPVVTPQGVWIFMLCEKIESTGAPKESTASEDAIRQALFEEKMELEAQKYLRNLRQQAFIEVRQKF
jgi:peptidyl-prolyl cis-trans isomerase SurA